MTKTRVRNHITRTIPKPLDDNMFAERSKLIRAIVAVCGPALQYCNTLVWKTDSCTITLDTFDLVIEIEDDLTIADFVLNFGEKWIVAHIDCATNEVRDLLNGICDIYGVDRIF